MSEKFNLTIHIIVLNCVCVYIIIVHCAGVNKRTWTACDSSPGQSRTLYEMSAGECVDECVKRPDCDVLRYCRSRKKCDIVKEGVSSVVSQENTANTGDGSSSSAQPSVDNGTCMEVQRQSIVVPQCGCAEGQICENNDCVISECPTLTIENAKVQGNIRVIGSKVKVTCLYMSDADNNTSISTCAPTGEWTNLPTCPDLPDNSVRVGPWLISVWTNGVHHDTADVFCKHSHNGQLIKVQTAEKHMRMVEYLNSLGGSQGDFWVQGRRQPSTHDYRFDDGTPLPTGSTFWGTGEPNHGYNQYCVRMSRQWGFNWGDRECDKTFGYICEYPGL